MKKLTKKSSQIETTYIYFKGKNGKGVYRIKSLKEKPLSQETIIEIKKDTSLQDICKDNSIEFYD